eukprot:IDg13380t1
MLAYTTDAHRHSQPQCTCVSRFASPIHAELASHSGTLRGANKACACTKSRLRNAGASGSARHSAGTPVSRRQAELLHRLEKVINPVPGIPFRSLVHYLTCEDVQAEAIMPIFAGT